MDQKWGLTVLLRKLCPKPRQRDTIPLESHVYTEIERSRSGQLIGAASSVVHSISKVLIKLFHRAVRGSVLLKHSGFALRRRSVNIKVLIKLFQKFAMSPEARSLWSLVATSETP